MKKAFVEPPGRGMPKSNQQNMRNTFCILIILFLYNFSFAQIGGQHIYKFLDLSSSARTTALGGELIAVIDDDIALGYKTPSLLNPSMHQQISFNSGLYRAGIHYGLAGFGWHFDNPGITTGLNIQYINYGEFERSDETGFRQGTFKAAEYAVNMGGSFRYSDRLTFGANIKSIFSYMDNYDSFGLAADFSGTYQDTSRNFIMTLVFKNAGAQLTAYDQEREPLPFDIQLGISKRLKHLPFRFSIIAHHLQTWDIRYDDPNAEQDIFLFGEAPETNEGTQLADKFFRHFIFNGEFLMGKKENFRLRLGYNHLRRAELSVDNLRGFAGFSLGLGLKINRFRIDFGQAFFHQGGGLSHFTISSNLREFRR